MHSLTSTLDGGEWPPSSTGRFIPQGKSPCYPFYRRLGGSQSRSERGDQEKKILASAGNRTLVVQPLA
jgi:hypothetical protein